MSPEEIDQFKEWGVPLPTRDVHIKDEDIAKNMEKAEVKSWRQEGNKLIAETQLGDVVNFLPTDTMLTGVKNNRPVLTKVRL